MAASMTDGSTDVRPRPFWPEAPFDLGRARVSYDVVSDELLVYFDAERRTGGVCDPIALADESIAVVYDWETGEIVGIQGIPFLLGAVRQRADWVALAWAVLAGEFGRQIMEEALPRFVAEVADAFRRQGLSGIPLTAPAESASGTG